MKRERLHFLSALLLEADLDPLFRGEADHGAGGNFHEHAVPGGHAHGGDDHVSPGNLGLSVPMYAFLLATVSGMSMPIGSALGIKLSPVSETTNAAWMAFGSGALLFAVSVEIYGHAIHSYHQGGMPGIAMLVLMVVSLVSSFLYTWVTRLLGTIEEEEEEGHDDDRTEAGRPPASDSFNAASPALRSSSGMRSSSGSSSSSNEEFSGRILRIRSEADLRSGDGAPSKAAQREDDEAPQPWTTSRARWEPPGEASFPSARSDKRRTTISATPRQGASPAGRLLLRRGSDSFRAPSALSNRGAKWGGLNAMLRMSKEEEERKKGNMAKLRWKKLREAVKTMHITAYLDVRAKETRERASTAQSEAAEVGSRSWTAREVGRKYIAKMDELKFWNLLRTKWSEQGPVEIEVNEARVQQNRECALNIFLMLFVDGIPEGILMGFMAAAGFLSHTFVLSLLVANFPEAFAASTLMVNGRFPTWQTLGMWTGLMLLVGSLAGLSCFLLLEYGGSSTAIELLKAIVEGLAGGAMISGIAAVMLPEAFDKSDHRGRIIQSSGFLCTLGFLMSVGLKTVLD